MFFQSHMRPATAGATANASYGTSRDSRRCAATFATATGEAEEFHSFNNGASGARNGGNAPKRHGKKKFSPNKKFLIIGIAAAAAVLLLVLLIVGAALFSSKDITYENNAYIAYADGDGKYHVAVNGKTLDMEFEGEVEVIPAADNSFAYVIDDGLEGKLVYLLKGKKLEPIISSSTPAMNILATASLKPGVVAEYDDRYSLYTDSIDGERIVKKTGNAQNFFISADASTVVYTAVPSNTENGASRRLYVYQDGSSEPIRSSAVPVAVSHYGDYVFASSEKSDGTTVLYVITTKDMEPYQISNSTGFTAINAMNRKGNEVLFRVSNGETTSTYFYRFKKGGEGESTRLRDSILTPLSSDGNVAVFDTFVGAYLSASNEAGDDGGVYYLNKEYTAQPVAKVQGQFSPDGKYFYYIHPTTSLLKQVDLKDDNFNDKTIYKDTVQAFAVTKKGNIYHLDTEGTLRFYDKSDDQSYRKGLGDDVSAISFYTYANEIYFTISDLEETNAYTSKEGSAKDSAKMASTTLTNVPSFSNPDAKRTYAYYYNVENGNWMLFYTANGKRFKMISNDCQSINGVEIPDLIG